MKERKRGREGERENSRTNGYSPAWGNLGVYGEGDVMEAKLIECQRKHQVVEVLAIRIKAQRDVHSVGIVLGPLCLGDFDLLDAIVLAGDPFDRRFEIAEISGCPELADQLLIPFPGGIEGHVFAELVIAPRDTEITRAIDFEIPVNARRNRRFQCDPSAECLFGRWSLVDRRPAPRRDLVRETRCRNAVLIVAVLVFAVNNKSTLLN